MATIRFKEDPQQRKKIRLEKVKKYLKEANASIKELKESMGVPTEKMDAHPDAPIQEQEQKTETIQEMSARPDVSSPVLFLRILLGTLLFCGVVWALYLFLKYL